MGRWTDGGIRGRGKSPLESLPKQSITPNREFGANSISGVWR